MDANYSEVGKSIAETKDLVAETEEKLKKAIAEFKQSFAAGT
jgi:F-type H+-transporting ATPase subunit alpha